MKKKLKIAVLIKRFITTGGSERYAAEITQRLLEKGHDIALYARIIDKELAKGMKLHLVPDKLKFSSVFNSFSFSLETARMLTGKTYDIIHSHERGYFQDISTVHTFPYKEGISQYSFLKKIPNVWLSPRSQMHFWLEQKQMDSLWLAPVSVSVRENIRKHYSRDNNVAVITPGVDIDWFHPKWITGNREKIRQEENIPEDELAVLFVGTEFRRKGLDYLIPAVGPEMCLLVVGKGERERHYKNLASECGVAEKVHFKGLSDDVRRYFAAADAVVLPSLSEAFGMSVLEGMACGLPVVASSNTGVSDLIENDLNGFVFNAFSELPEMLNQLKDIEKRKQLGAQARKTAERYTWDIAAGKYEQLFYQIAGKKF